MFFLLLIHPFDEFIALLYLSNLADLLSLDVVLLFSLFSSLYVLWISCGKPVENDVESGNWWGVRCVASCGTHTLGDIYYTSCAHMYTPDGHVQLFNQTLTTHTAKRRRLSLSSYNIFHLLQHACITPPTLTKRRQTPPGEANRVVLRKTSLL